jgi:hypothetical protein
MANAGPVVGRDASTGGAPAESKRQTVKRGWQPGIPGPAPVPGPALEPLARPRSPVALAFIVIIGNLARFEVMVVVA